jgi:hypothetical protein
MGKPGKGRGWAAALGLLFFLQAGAQSGGSLEDMPPVENVQQAVYFLNIQKSFEMDLMRSLYAQYQQRRDEETAVMQELQALNFDADAAFSSMAEEEKEREVLAAAERLESAERRLQGVLDELRQLRGRMAECRRRILQYDLKIAEVREQSPRPASDLTGMWMVSIQPMGLVGEMRLFQNGVMLTGAYRLSGGWRGNVSGFTAGDHLVLERYDAEKGHAGQFIATISQNGNELSGRWTSYDVTAGQNIGAFKATRLKSGE